MSLAAGTRLGPYEVLGLIGAGGMGEVYRARDTRLDRSVAVKVLPADLASDAERRTRFEREARTISTLTHPHICTLYDVGDREGVPYLVMEHLAGETLAERLAKGPLPLDQVIDLGAQIADALSAAHRHGIVHRDLKPANVMLTKAGAKLLDFGLAKLRPPEGVRLVRDSSATMAQDHDVTAAGTLVGTLPYMAPEQVEGRETDARTDLWALGCLLYEMVTGQRAFEGATTGTLVGAILAKEPAPLATRQPLTPPALERLVKRCLAKDPDQRWDSAHDVADELRWISAAGSEAAARVGATPAAFGAARTRRRAWLLGATLAVVGILTTIAALSWLRTRAPTAPVRVARLSLDVRPAEALDGGAVEPRGMATPGGSRTALAWTPDGQALVFVGRRGAVRQLYVRRLDTAGARPLANTERAQAPAVSADGRWVAFWARGAIRKVSIDGGPATDLAPGVWPPPVGLVWDDGGRVLFGHQDGRIWAAPPGGPPEAVTSRGEREVKHAFPCPLPGGRVLLYTIRKREYSWGDEEVVAQTLATGARKTLLKDAIDARYLPTGHLLFVRRGVLFAVPFDAERLEVQGTPVPLLDSVAQALSAVNSDDVTGAAQMSVSASGVLAWLSGAVVPYPETTLVTVDRRGKATPLPAAPRSYGPVVRLSPDGRWLAVTVHTVTEAGLWLYDLERGTLAPLNRDVEAANPIWSPDGRRVVFSFLNGGQRSLAEQPADGTSPPGVLVPGSLYPLSWTPDGRELAVVSDPQPWDLMKVTLGGERAKVSTLVAMPESDEAWADFSPDGRWMAYASNVSGRREVYVRRHPGPGPATQVSIDGGWNPAWHPNGRELFFADQMPGQFNQMMVAPFEPGSPPRIGRPRVLFKFDPAELNFMCLPGRCYDVSPDGERFYVRRSQVPSPPPPVTHVDVVLNWFEELKAKVPSGQAK